MEKSYSKKSFQSNKDQFVDHRAIDALNDAWNSIAKTKKELSSVSNRIRESESFDCRSPDLLNDDEHFDSRRKPKHKKYIHSISSHAPEEEMHVKENIPPASILKPLIEHDFIPTRKTLYNTNYSYQPEFNVINNFYSNAKFVGKEILKDEKKKEAISRLKEKINQQKMNLSSSLVVDAPALSGQSFPQKVQHSEDSPVEINTNEENTGQTMKRKVTQAPHAPSYRGFNPAVSIAQMEQQPTSQMSRHIARKQRQIEISNNSRKMDVKATSTTANKNISKNKSGKVKKPNRIVAPKKSPQLITTSSWRLSENVKKKLKSELMLKKKLQNETANNKQSNQKESKKLPQSEMTSSKKSSVFSTNRKESTSMKSQESSSVIKASSKDMAPSIPKDLSVDIEKTNSDIEKTLSEQPLEEATGNLSEDESLASKSITKDMEKSEIISSTAQQVLQEMRQSPNKDKKISQKSPSKKEIMAVVDTGLPKSRTIMKKSPPAKRKLEEANYPKSKVRHYDKTEVKKYMAKQLAQRKLQREQKEEAESKRREEQKRKMEELYKKQKSALQESLKIKKKNYSTPLSSDQEYPGRSEYSAFDALRNKLATLSSSLASEENRSSILSESTLNRKSFEKTISIIERNKQYDQQISPGNIGASISKTPNEDSHLLNAQQPSSIEQNAIKTQAISHHTVSETNGLAPRAEVTQLTKETTYHDIEKSVYEKTKADRVAAIRATAEALKQRLDFETKRLTSIALLCDEKATTLQVNEASNSGEHLSEVFPGEYPGVNNLEEAVQTNNQVEALNKAAETIHSSYKEDTERHRLQWSLPSGKTLYQTLEEGRRKALMKDIKLPEPVELASSRHPSILSTINFESLSKPAFASSRNKEDIPRSYVEAKQTIDLSTSTVSHRRREFQDSLSNENSGDVSIASIPSPHSQVDGMKDTSDLTSYHDVSKLNREGVDHPTLYGILKKHPNTPPDRYSMINVFTRKYTAFKKQLKEKSDSELLSCGTDTEKLLADAYTHEQFDKDDSQTSNDTLSEKSVEDDALLSHTANSVSHQTDETYSEVVYSPSRNQSAEINSYSQTQQLQRQFLSPKPANKTSDSDESEKLFSPHSHTPDSMKRLPDNARLSLMPEVVQSSMYAKDDGLSPLTPISLSSDKEGDSPTITSQQHTPPFESDHTTANDCTPTATDHTPSASDLENADLNPVMSSTRRSPRSFIDVKDGTPLRSFDDKSILRERRMSPNTLEMKLRAEINMCEAARDSLQQLDDMDRIRNIVQAQHESVALAQLIKARQHSHQSEIEKLSLQAKENSLKATADLEAARIATANVNAETAKVLADIKIKTSNQVLESTQNLAKAQAEATATAKDALTKIDIARQEAANAYKLAAERQIVDVEKITTAAASAASSQAVEVALRHHKQQLEELRMNSMRQLSDESFRDSSHTSSKSSGSYSNDSRTSTSSKTNTRHKSDHSQSISKETSTAEVSRKSVSQKISEDISIEEQSLSNQKDSNHSLDVKSPTKSATNSISENTSLISKKKSVQTKTDDSRTQSLAQENISEQISSHSNIRHEDTSKINSHTDRSIKHFEKFSVESIGEDLPIASDNENDISEALSGDLSEYQRRGNSQEDKFHSSMTEDELKHEFRMVLPSENHRRKSLDLSNISTTGVETSSDELVTPKAGKQKKSSMTNDSTFFEGDTFQKFTSEMVRQYIQEEEMRAKHQQALLALREKAIVEKTKAEMAFLEIKKKKLKGKGQDDKMPPLSKKQRALALKLQAEKNEIRRLQEANQAASEERKFMLKQQRQIQKIRATTQKIWSKVKESHPSSNFDEGNVASLNSINRVFDSIDSATKSKEIAEEISHHRVTSPSRDISNEDISKSKNISENISDSYESAENTLTPSESVNHENSSSQKKSLSIEESIRQTSSKRDYSPSAATSSAVSHSDGERSKSQRNGEQADKDREEENSFIDSSSISKDLKKLNYMSSEDYLTKRERKLRSRQRKLQEIIEADNKLRPRKEQLDEKESKLREQIKRAIDSKKLNFSTGNLGTVESEESGARSSTSSDDHPTKSISVNEKQLNHVTDADASIGEDLSSIASNDESVVSESHVKTASNNSNSPSKSVNTLKPSVVETGQTTSKSSKSWKKTSPVTYSQNTFEASTESVKQSSVKQQKGSNDEESLTEGASDASDVEQRLKKIEKQLQRRYSDLERLRKQKEKQQLRRRERALLKELEDVEREIDKEIKDCLPTPETTPTRNKQPRVLSPRNSLDSIILPEKIKLRKDKDLRRTLDLSEKDLSDSSLSPRSISKKSKSFSQTQNETNVVNNERSSENQLQKTVSESGTRKTEKGSDYIDKSHGSSSRKDITIVDDLSLKSESLKSPSNSLEEASRVSDHVLLREEKSASVSEHNLSNHRSPSASSKKSSISEKIDKNKSVSGESAASLQSTSGGESAASLQSTSVKHSTNIDSRPSSKSLQQVFSKNSDKSIQQKSPETSDATHASSVADDYDDEIFESVRSSGGKTSVISTAKSSISKENSFIPTQKTSNEIPSEVDLKHSESSDIIDNKSFPSYKEDITSKQSEENGDIYSSVHSQSISEDETVNSDNKSHHSQIVLSSSSSKESIPLNEKEISKSDGSGIEGSLNASDVSEKVHSPDLSIKTSISKHDSVSEDIPRSSKGFTSENSTSENLISNLAGSTKGFVLGERVLVEGAMLGIIRFLGKVPFSPVPVAGIELDKAVGTNDGSFQGNYYFTCAADHGYFTTIDKLQKVDSDDVKSSGQVGVTSDTSSISLMNDKDILKVSDYSERMITNDDSAESSSEHDSLIVPSPTKLDLNPLADKITDGIMKTLLEDSFEFSNIALREKGGKDVERTRNEEIDNVLTSMLSDAISHMIKVNDTKQQKLKDEISLSPKDGFMSLIISDTSPKLSLGREETYEVTDKREQLKSVHDVLGSLIGDDDDDEEKDDTPLSDSSQETSKKEKPEEKIFQIPYTENQTQKLVFTAYNDIIAKRRNKIWDDIKPSSEYLNYGMTHGIFDEYYTKLFNELVFDLTKSLIDDLDEFKRKQSKTVPKWMKNQKRTYAKFVRKNHLTNESDFSHTLSEYIAVCLGLLPGRPSLDKLRKRLPLNPSKKDYVDAILIEEIREEEPQWVNYENDELTVKYQLADNILEGLLDEIVDTLSSAS